MSDGTLTYLWGVVCGMVAMRITDWAITRLREYRERGRRQETTATEER